MGVKKKIKAGKRKVDLPFIRFGKHLYMRLPKEYIKGKAINKEQYPAAHVVYDERFVLGAAGILPNGSIIPPSDRTPSSLEEAYRVTRDGETTAIAMILSYLILSGNPITEESVTRAYQWVSNVIDAGVFGTLKNHGGIYEYIRAIYNKNVLGDKSPDTVPESFKVDIEGIWGPLLSWKREFIPDDVMESIAGVEEPSDFSDVFYKLFKLFGSLFFGGQLGISVTEDQLYGMVEGFYRDHNDISAADILVELIETDRLPMSFTNIDHIDEILDEIRAKDKKETNKKNALVSAQEGDI